MGTNLKKDLRIADGWFQSALIPGKFLTDGATDPSVFTDNTIAQVQELTTGAVIFFRVTLREKWTLAGSRTVITAGAEGVDPSDDLTVTFFAGTGLTDAGGDVFDATTDIDIVLRDGGTAVNTAGITVHFNIILDLTNT